MFRKTDPERQLSLFSTVSQQLSDKSRDIYSREKSWHNIFFREVVYRIREDIFAPLFSSDNGAPNQSVRLLVGMMIIKEGKGVSDQELFEDVSFNLLTRKALGLTDLDDPIPALSTYYLFRQRLKEHFENTGDDLLEQCFQHITKDQAIAYNVSGKSLRLDSKLIGSNIAYYSRYSLIHKTIGLFYKKVDKQWLAILPPKIGSLLEEVCKEDSEKTVFASDKETITKKLKQLGTLIYQLLQVRPIPDCAEYETLRRVFNEQYTTHNKDDYGQASPKDGKSIEATSVQSPYDTECTYRKKNGESTKGYSHNLSETCDADNSVNLITDIQTQVATAADNDFMELAVENTQDVLDQKVEITHADGAYNSEENQAFANENSMALYLTGFQGAAPRYQLTQKNGELTCYDTKLKKTIEIILTQQGKYRIKLEKGYRYFTSGDIEKQELRRSIEQLPKEIANKRNNVEASIYQLAYPLRKDKTKYRGLFKNKIWAVLRCTWVNCVRIVKISTKKSEKDGICQQIEEYFVILILPMNLKPLRIR